MWTCPGSTRTFRVDSWGIPDVASILTVFDPIWDASEDPTLITAPLARGDPEAPGSPLSRPIYQPRILKQLVQHDPLCDAVLVPLPLSALIADCLETLTTPCAGPRAKKPGESWSVMRSCSSGGTPASHWDHGAERDHRWT